MTDGHKKENTMDVTWDIPDKLLDNHGDFNSSFYKRFALRKRENPVIMDNGLEKDYLFPTFYGDVTCAMGVFFCSYKQAKALVREKLGHKVKPVGMGGGRAIAAFSCYEYRKVLGVRPYNEIALAIPIMVNPGINNPPVVPMISDSFNRFGYYIASMPVTSEENTQRGHKIWGLPKVTQPVEISNLGQDIMTVAREADGEPYFSLTIPKNGNPEEFDVSSYLYTRHEGELKRSRTSFKGLFHVNKNMSLLLKKGVVPEKPYLNIGQGKSAELLRYLEIEPMPFQTRYSQSISSCFDLPDENVPSWMKGF